ncbi:DNA-binding FadR family transcriptional regulator [Pseudonocardia sediminis]|uniref:DNA-binding FadR family transcriptional regulator n=1 Tax=Pseudonocardia sediminis TaxID=1397368 RepID=A0A4Q7UZY1_PSEST|nr:FCD domain-containing protein [Pseudonocardia sediminis]RZT85769.1 DNA-binding FadR family transcriptional regulator [Pseudonocardia sediminis]
MSEADVPVVRRGRSRAESVAEAVQSDIVERGAVTGDRLGLRTDLIDRYGVSPSVMNEALGLLRDRGLVTVRPGPSGGVFVAEQPAQVRLGAIDLWFSAAVPNPRELFEARTFFDDAFGAVAVDRAGPNDIRAMESALHDMRTHTDDPAAYMRATVAFHAAIAYATDLAVVVGLYETVLALLRGGIVRAAFVEPRDEMVAHALQIHEGMTAAIRDRDHDAMTKLLALHAADLERVQDESP